MRSFEPRFKKNSASMQELIISRVDAKILAKINLLVISLVKFTIIYSPIVLLVHSKSRKTSPETFVSES